MSKEEEMKLYNAKDRIQADMILDILGKNNIPAYKKNGIMDVYAGHSMTGEDIFINSKDLEKARDALLGIGIEADEDSSSENTVRYSKSQSVIGIVLAVILVVCVVVSFFINYVVSEW